MKFLMFIMLISCSGSATASMDYCSDTYLVSGDKVYKTVNVDGVCLASNEWTPINIWIKERLK